jgi:hypothetical protein
MGFLDDIVQRASGLAGQLQTPSSQNPAGRAMVNAPRSWPLDVFATVPMQSSPAILNQNSNFASGLAPWVAGNGATGTISPLWAFGNANQSALFTGDGVTANPNIASETTIPVTALQAYIASVEYYSPQGWPTTQVGIQWLNAAGGSISFSFSALIPVPANALAGTLISEPATAPAGATRAQIILQMQGTPAATVQMFAALAQLNLGNAVGNGLGSAVANLGPAIVREHWQPGSAFVKVSTNVNEAACDLFLGTTLQSAGQQIAHSSKASSGDTCALSGDMPTGYQVFAVWSGGDAGPLVQATLRLTGSRSIGAPQ